MQHRLFFFAVALVVSGAACAATADPSNFSEAENADAGDRGANAPTFATNADASEIGATAKGSPLCGERQSRRCFPDDDGTSAKTPSEGACSRVPDAGTASADAAAEGCRLVETDASSVETTCAKADLRGVDGARCASGSDCAPGYECMSEEKGSVCRRYCCSGSCDRHTSHNGGPTYCDVRNVAEQKTQRAPVCMPIKDCRLLDTYSCESDETCAVVDERGATGCVPRGPQKVGEPCDVEHCEANLTCLGSPGNRRCYKLCKTSQPASNSCGPMQACTTGAIFLDSGYGVCKCGNNPQCED